MGVTIMMQNTNGTDIKALLAAEGWHEVEVEKMFRNTPKPDGWFGCFAREIGVFGASFPAEGNILPSQKDVRDALLLCGRLLVKFGPVKQDRKGGDDHMTFRDMESLPDADEARRRILAVRNIGGTTADKLITAFGRYSCFVASRHPELLPEAGLSKKRCAIVAAGLSTLSTVDRLRAKVPKDILPERVLNNLYDLFGERILEILTQVPYSCLDRILPDSDLKFKQIDKVALYLNPHLKDSKERYTAAVSDCVCQVMAETKSSCLACGVPDALGIPPYAAVLSEYFNSHYDQFGIMSPETMWQWCIFPDVKCRVVRDPDGQGLYLYGRGWLAREQALASDLLYTAGTAVDRRLTVKAVSAVLSEYERVFGKKLAGEQAEAVLASLSSRLSVVTGIPGSGKTTTASCILYIFAKLTKRPVYLMAPTGLAVKRLVEATEHTGIPAGSGTIDHFLVKAGLSENFGEQFKHALVIVDEASMIGLMKAGRLTDLISEAHVVFLGDVDQLPSIEIGSFFKDLIEADICPASRLSINHRSKAYPALGKAFGLIKDGVTIMDDAWSDIKDGSLGWSFFVEPVNVAKTGFLDQVWARYCGFLSVSSDLKDIIILSPTNDMVRACNFFLQDKLNPESLPAPQFSRRTGLRIHTDRGIAVKGCFCYGKGDDADRRLLRIGDRAVFVKNKMADYGLVNGDMGVITEFREDLDDSRGHIVVFETDGGVHAEIEADDFCYLEPAYAVSVHKSQGCEYRHVILLFKDMTWDVKGLFAQRNLLYTAVTRAKEVCAVMGDIASLEHFIRTPLPERTSLLQQRLQGRL